MCDTCLAREPSSAQRLVPVWHTVHNDLRRKGVMFEQQWQKQRPSYRTITDTARSASTTAAGTSNWRVDTAHRFTHAGMAGIRNVGAIPLVQLSCRRIVGHSVRRRRFLSFSQRRLLANVKLQSINLARSFILSTPAWLSQAANAIVRTWRSDKVGHSTAVCNRRRVGSKGAPPPECAEDFGQHESSVD
jgi:hypothetical protein